MAAHLGLPPSVLSGAVLLAARAADARPARPDVPGRAACRGVPRRLREAVRAAGPARRVGRCGPSRRRLSAGGERLGRLAGPRGHQCDRHLDPPVHPRCPRSAGVLRPPGPHGAVQEPGRVCWPEGDRGRRRQLRCPDRRRPRLCGRPDLGHPASAPLSGRRHRRPGPLRRRNRSPSCSGRRTHRHRWRGLPRRHRRRAARTRRPRRRTPSCEADVHPAHHHRSRVGRRRRR